MKKIILAICISTAGWTAARAGGDDILLMAERFYSAGDYYSAITEVMRYQCLFPSGPLNSRSMLLMGKAYFRGGNYQAAADVFTLCHREFSARRDGEEALYLAGFAFLAGAAPLEWMKSADLYRVTYTKPLFAEELDRDACFASALGMDLAGSMREVRRYQGLHRRGKYREEVGRLEGLVREETGRPRRHLWLSVLGSVFVPGFGHFYTGNYAAGFLTLFTNAFFSFMIYNGYRLHDTFQMVFFGIAEAIVYQYNIFGAVRAADEYNGKRDRDFFKRVRLEMSVPF